MHHDRSSLPSAGRRGSVISTTEGSREPPAGECRSPIVTTRPRNRWHCGPEGGSLVERPTVVGRSRVQVARRSVSVAQSSPLRDPRPQASTRRRDDVLPAAVRDGVPSRSRRDAASASTSTSPQPAGVRRRRLRPRLRRGHVGRRMRRRKPPEPRLRLRIADCTNEISLEFARRLARARARTRSTRSTRCSARSTASATASRRGRALRGARSGCADNRKEARCAT